MTLTDEQIAEGLAKAQTVLSAHKDCKDFCLARTQREYQVAEAALALKEKLEQAEAERAALRIAIAGRAYIGASNQDWVGIAERMRAKDGTVRPAAAESRLAALEGALRDAEEDHVENPSRDHPTCSCGATWPCVQKARHRAALGAGDAK